MRPMSRSCTTQLQGGPELAEVYGLLRVQASEGLWC